MQTHMFQLMPLPLTVSCSSKIQIGFAFLVPAHPGSPGKRAVKRVCVCVCLMHISIAQLCTLHYCCPSVGPSVSDFDKSTKPYTCSFDYQIRGRKLNLAYINPMTSLRWPSSFLLKPDNEFSAIMSSLNIFHSLMTILLKKNFAISNLTHMLILHQNN